MVADSDIIIPAVRRETAGVLLDLVRSARDSVNRLWSSTPRIGSHAAELLNGSQVSSTPFIAVSYSLAAGVEHVYAISKLLRLDARLGPSIAVLVRGSVEAFGRVWWLLSSPDTDTFNLRGAALLEQEIRYAQRNGVQTMKRLPDGSSIVVEDPLAEVRMAYPAVHPTARTPRVPGYTDLAVEVMRAAGFDSGGTTYSHLSGVAHGEGTTVLNFGRLSPGSTPDGDALFTFALPLADARRYAYITSNTLNVIMENLVAAWGDQAEVERWDQVRERTFSTLNRLLHPDS